MSRYTMRQGVNNAMRQRLFTEYLNEQKLITNDKLSFKKRNKMKKYTFTFLGVLNGATGKRQNFLI